MQRWKLLELVYIPNIRAYPGASAHCEKRILHWLDIPEDPKWVKNRWTHWSYMDNDPTRWIFDIYEYCMSLVLICDLLREWIVTKPRSWCCVFLNKHFGVNVCTHLDTYTMSLDAPSSSDLHMGTYLFFRPSEWPETCVSKMRGQPTPMQQPCGAWQYEARISFFMYTRRSLTTFPRMWGVVTCLSQATWNIALFLARVT